MERGVPVSLRKPFAIFACLLAAWLFALAARAGSGRELILAASAQSPLPRLSVQETRKLYLGVPVEKNGVTLKPLINSSDALLYEVFLQKVTFMSAEAYDRQVISIVFRLGGQRPEVVTDRQQLNASLLESPNTVTFIWASDLQAYRGLRPVGVLWSGEID
jgi:hypothetical protein